MLVLANGSKSLSKVFHNSGKFTQKESHHFQAEIQQLLDIVIHSLYTDKEIFILELFPTLPMPAKNFVSTNHPTNPSVNLPLQPVNVGMQVELKSQNGKALASFLLGKEHMSQQGGGEGWLDGRYVETADS